MTLFSSENILEKLEKTVDGASSNIETKQLPAINEAIEGLEIKLRELNAEHKGCVKTLGKISRILEIIRE